MPLSFPPFQPAVARLRGRSEDWVSQTQDLRLGSPLTEGSGYSTPVSNLGTEVRIDEVMVDESMVCFTTPPVVDPTIVSLALQGEDANNMAVSPPRLPSVLPDANQVSLLQRPDLAYPSSLASHRSPNLLQIPLIQIQTATPSPVQMFGQDTLQSFSLSATSVSDAPFAAHATQPPTPSVQFAPLDANADLQAPPIARKQRFTMGPRADCEMCRMRVKGHYMHFD